MRKQAIQLLALTPTIFLGCNNANKPAGNRQASANNELPNVLLLVADDMGYSDLHCYGGVSKTPNLDKLANNGVRFTDFYAAAPNCSPSRAGLLTGRSPAMSGIYNYRPPKHPMHLRDSETTLAEILKYQGYQTAHIGKWHLGCLPQDTSLTHPQPCDQGFDYSFGTENNAQPSHLNPVNFVRNGRPLNVQKGYSCRILVHEAVDWFNNQYKKEAPFFMYVAFHEPHKKVASPPELVKQYSEYPLKDAEYLANIENLDRSVGELIEFLKRGKMFNNTLIIFSSDNGSYRKASNGNLKAVKSYLYDGGIRVPGIFHWRALEQSGKVIHQAAGFVDIVPTICDILKITPPKPQTLDGTSILNLLNGKQFIRKKPLYWFFYRTSPEIAIRIDNFMILGKDNDTTPRTHRFSAPDMRYIKQMKITDYELYDMQKDMNQSENLFAQHPKAGIYKEMINNKLVKIQQNGFEWKSLPEAKGKRKVKTHWVKY